MTTYVIDRATWRVGSIVSQGDDGRVCVQWEGVRQREMLCVTAGNHDLHVFERQVMIPWPGVRPITLLFDGSSWYAYASDGPVIVGSTSSSPQRALRRCATVLLSRHWRVN